MSLAKLNDLFIKYFNDFTYLRGCSGNSIYECIYTILNLSFDISRHAFCQYTYATLIKSDWFVVAT